MPPAPMRSLAAGGRPPGSLPMLVAVSVEAEDPPRRWMRASKPNAVGLGTTLFDFVSSTGVKERRGENDAGEDVEAAVTLLTTADKSNKKRMSFSSLSRRVKVVAVHHSPVYIFETRCVDQSVRPSI